MSENCSGNCGSCSSKGSCENEKLEERMSHIAKKRFVLSGKGGVGKSTVAAVLALSLAKRGRRVALLDADFHGPSQPTLFGLQEVQLTTNEQGELAPAEVAGVRLVSIGLLLEDADRAVIWRGPAKMAVLKQLLEETAWGELDDLIVDFPPGTGDESLSACQLVSGDKEAIIVTTPQEVSLADCRKCLDFCIQLKLKVAGIVENMSCFECPSCHQKHEIFGEGGGRKLAEDYGIKLLARLPLRPRFGRDCDFGKIAESLEEKFPEADQLAEELLRK